MIKRIISTERREWTVITSDREIASEAWRYGSIPVSSEVFYEILMAVDRTRTSGIGIEAMDKEVEYHNIQPSAFHKGNPRRLSKKDKAIKRAISKL